MNILIVKLSAIGDVIHTLPALNALRAAFPDARITWLVEEAAASLVEGHPALDRVLVCRRKSWIRDWKRGSRETILAEIVAFIRELRDMRYDVVLDFQALLKGAIWIALSRGKRKIGFDRGMAHMEHSHWFLNERIPPISMEVHALERNLQMLEPLGIRETGAAYRLPMAVGHRQTVHRLLMAASEREGPVVCINPVAKWETKLWRTDGFAVVADQLIDAYRATIVFTGAGEDGPIIDDIRRTMEKTAIDLSGKTDLMTLAALYERANLVISTDTGPMHLAAAVETPVVALFGPTAPWRTGPCGQQHRAIRLKTACGPCFKQNCDRPFCMRQIDAKTVFRAAGDILQASGFPRDPDRHGGLSRGG